MQVFALKILSNKPTAQAKSFYIVY